MGNAALAHAVGSPLEVGKVVARHLLVRADQQVRELPSGGAGLGQQLGDGGLQDVFGEQKRAGSRGIRAAPPGGAAGNESSMSGLSSRNQAESR